MFPWFIQMAHKYDSKIHGLGYTRTENFTRFRFDSVDSTTWTVGARFGQLCFFKDGKIIKESSIIRGIKTRNIKNVKGANLHNFLEWVKFSQYLERI